LKRSADKGPQSSCEVRDCCSAGRCGLRRELERARGTFDPYPTPAEPVADISIVVGNVRFARKGARQSRPIPQPQRIQKMYLSRLLARWGGQSHGPPLRVATPTAFQEGYSFLTPDGGVQHLTTPRSEKSDSREGSWTTVAGAPQAEAQAEGGGTQDLEASAVSFAGPRVAHAVDLENSDESEVASVALPEDEEKSPTWRRRDRMADSICSLTCSPEVELADRVLHAISRGAELEELSVLLETSRAELGLSWRAVYATCRRMGLCLSNRSIFGPDLMWVLRTQPERRVALSELQGPELRVVRRAFCRRLKT